MTRTEFENLLDRLYPENKTLREQGRKPLPGRLGFVCVHLFCHPRIGTAEERALIRERKIRLDAGEYLIFDKEQQS